MKEKIKELFKKHKLRVIVSCNEYHLHSASKGCIAGPKESVDVCILCEEILFLEDKLHEIKILAEKGI